MAPHAPLRVLRAFTVTAAVLGLATGAHTAGGGHLPPAPILALLAVLVLVPVTFLSRRQLKLPAMLGILGTGQLILHGAFTMFPGTEGHCTGPGIAAHGHHKAFGIPECATAATSAMADQQMGGTPDGFMSAAHALAVAVTAVLLARGEAALWQILAWLRPLAIALRPAALPVAVRIPALRTGLVPVPHPCLRIPALRGPPPLAGIPVQSA